MAKENLNPSDSQRERAGQRKREIQPQKKVQRDMDSKENIVMNLQGNREEQSERERVRETKRALRSLRGISSSEILQQNCEQFL